MTFPLRLAAATVAACVLLAATAARAADEPAPETNGALLSRTLVAAARRVIAQAPLTPGSKVTLEAGDGTAMANEVERAVLTALTERRVEAVIAPKPAATPAGTQAPTTTGDTTGTMSMQEALARQQQLAEESRQRTEAGAAGSVPGTRPTNPSAVPHLSLTIHEARVDYPRIYRAGLLGGVHVERRALSRLSARLAHGEPPSVFWVAEADTSIGDSVPRGDLRALEDANRPETRGTVPPEGWQKIAEPALVVVLVVGLVSLFYSNRP